MKKGDSHSKGRRKRPGRKPGRETLWNGAAVAGLLLIGLLLGGVAGVFLDRQGLLGGPSTEERQAAPQPDALPPAGPAPAPRLLTAAPEIDREALEAQYHEVLRQGRALEAPAAPDGRLQDWQGAPGGSAAELWQQHAVATLPDDGRPMIAIVLDDVGVNRRGAEAAIALPGPLTLSFMTYARDLAAMTARARAAGHELMLHVPMEPRDAALDPGPNVLRADLPRAELAQRLAWGLDRFEGYVGINNHMGSRFTASEEGMALVMAQLKMRGLLFLDSVTAADSVAARQAARAGVPYAVRDVFLDNEPDDIAAIHRQLALLEQAARAHGYAVGIGHPHDGTVTALRQWIPEMQARGFTLVPISAIVRHRQSLAAQQELPRSG